MINVALQERVAQSHLLVDALHQFREESPFVFDLSDASVSATET